MKGVMVTVQRRRTQYFKITLLFSCTLSVCFLLGIALFGTRLAAVNFSHLTDAIFVIMTLAAGSFLLFSFLPYFRGDRRWYSISALLTLVFFAGAGMLWQIPLTGGI